METKNKIFGYMSYNKFYREDLIERDRDFYKEYEEMKSKFRELDPILNNRLYDAGYLNGGCAYIIEDKLLHGKIADLRNLHSSFETITGEEMDYRPYIIISPIEISNSISHQCGTIFHSLTIVYKVIDFGISIQNGDIEQVSFRNIVGELNCKNTLKSKLLSYRDPEFKSKVKMPCFELSDLDDVDYVVEEITPHLKMNYCRGLERLVTSSSNSFLAIMLEVLSEILNGKEMKIKNVRKITVYDFIPVASSSKEHIPGIHEMVGLIPKSGLIEYDDNTIREMNAGELDRVPAFNASYKHIIETIFNPDEHWARSVEIPYSSREGDCTLVYRLNMKWVGEYMSLMSIAPIFIEKEHKIEKTRGKKLTFNITGLYSTCNDKGKIKTALQNIFSKIQLYTTTNGGEEPCPDVNFEKVTLKSFEPSSDGLMRLSVDLEFTSNEDVDTKDRRFVLDYCGNQIIGEEDPRKSHDLRLARSLIIRKWFQE